MHRLFVNFAIGTPAADLFFSCRARADLHECAGIGGTLALNVRALTQGLGEDQNGERQQLERQSDVYMSRFPGSCGGCVLAGAGGWETATDGQVHVGWGVTAFSGMVRNGKRHALSPAL